MKRLLFTLALSSLSLMSFSQSKQRATGDVNGDGKVDIEDVTCLVQQIMKNQFQYITLYDGHTITATSSNTVYGTVNGGGAVSTEMSITLTATPNSGYQFDGWYVEENLISKMNPYTFTPTTDMQIVGKFSTKPNSGNPTVTTPTGNMEEPE